MSERATQQPRAASCVEGPMTQHRVRELIHLAFPALNRDLTMRNDRGTTKKGERRPGAKHSGPLPYSPPSLEHLGSWSALTLQQTVPITMMPQPDDRHATDAY